MQFRSGNLHDDISPGLGLWRKYCNEQIASNYHPLISDVLLVSHEIIAKHGGIIGVESPGAIGQGSVFYIKLPAHTLSASDDNKKHRPSLSTARTTALSSKMDASSRRLFSKWGRALVVDDSQLNRKMITRIVDKSFENVLQVMYWHNIVISFKR